ncbi:PhnB protein [Fulvivirga imtechensis AK7]|uniref:PhnB protein n=1 Tax=Fulvivirga imtechensis AK7 TaxID=1237149 RepID=L8JLJ5_9BACT|nr:VOC family protein [Fulvivirga imtechensis]ELR68379.1 PhnB protein [Fulvivirga imtechensis AK7]
MATTLNPYLHFSGNAEEVFTFYQSVFGGEFMGGITRYKDMPMEGHKDVSEEDQNKVLHVALPISNDSVLMGSDVPEYMGKVNQGNNFFISIHTDSKKEADRLFNGLSAGGSVSMPMADAPWGAYFGMFKDKFGVQWMVTYRAES